MEYVNLHNAKVIGRNVGKVLITVVSLPLIGAIAQASAVLVESYKACDDIMNNLKER